jgi:hypothetical protein
LVSHQYDQAQLNDCWHFSHHFPRYWVDQRLQHQCLTAHLRCFSKIFQLYLLLDYYYSS